MQGSSRSESLTRHETGFISLMLSLQLALSKQCCIQAKANGVTPDSQPKSQGNVANKKTEELIDSKTNMPSWKDLRQLLIRISFSSVKYIWYFLRL